GDSGAGEERGERLSAGYTCEECLGARTQGGFGMGHGIWNRGVMCFYCGLWDFSAWALFALGYKVVLFELGCIRSNVFSQSLALLLFIYSAWDFHVCTFCSHH